MKQPLLLDGAIGTELRRRGATSRDCLELLNITTPDVVSRVHGDFQRAGAHLHTCNTFGANAVRLAAHDFAHRVAEINTAAVAVARSVAGDAQVAGSVGPTGAGRGDAQAHMAFRQQAAALDAAGVDVFTCETFGNLEELRAAISAIRSVSSRPIWAQVFLLSTGRTPFGASPIDVARVLSRLPVQAIGINCTAPEIAAPALLEMSGHTSLPLIFRPSAGIPRSGCGLLQYPLTPKEFASILFSLTSVASFVGGCCGVTPDHICAAKEMYRKGAAVGTDSVVSA